jgi:hypothetical protein
MTIRKTTTRKTTTRKTTTRKTTTRGGKPGFPGVARLL